jgi:hypothetical protein
MILVLMPFGANAKPVWSMDPLSHPVAINFSFQATGSFANCPMLFK